ncbi:acid-sensing ion channel 4-A-like [Leucoraja erinacea]|uniref:acid-sensing ion channel 4-A-like n=1 Tax=Leucoraja erinaceus TaxID=7782 RepID=UPI002455B7A5|nr:acid-sensing ion channel 4-A-like [Leucoraja erinacea]
MPLEIVCKIAFSEEGEQGGEGVECERRSLLDESVPMMAANMGSFADTSSLHGLRHVFVPSGCGVKPALWALACLCSLLLVVYQVVSCSLTYLHYHHLTALDAAPRHHLPFPAVTICNMNRFRHTALTDADIYHLANMTGLPPKSTDAHRAVQQGYPPPNMLDIFNRTGHQIEDMLKNCNFSGAHCSASNFTTVSAPLN